MKKQDKISQNSLAHAMVTLGQVTIPIKTVAGSVNSVLAGTRSKGGKAGCEGKGKKKGYRDRLHDNSPTENVYGFEMLCK